MSIEPAEISGTSTTAEDTLHQPRRIDVPGEEGKSFGEGFDDKRLWIGNLDPKITEFAVLKIAEKYGTIRKLDFIYHKGGPDKGLSKGYCFVSFRTWDAAEQARINLDGKQIKGRPMYVKWAHGSKFEDMMEAPKKAETPSTAKSVNTALAAASLPTAHNSLSEASPQSKIQAIEAKLRLMEATQNEFGVNQSIQAHPGYNPAALTSQNNRRTAPYHNRRVHSSGSHRNRSRR